MLLNKDFIFWFCALLGSGLFIIQFLLNLFVGVDHDDMDDTSWDALRIKWLSKQTFAGLLMMFGWTAITCQKEFALSVIPSITIASAVGLVTIFITGYLFKGARRLRSTGNVFNLDEAIGKEAIVYQQILKGSAGKVSLSLQNLTHEIDAVSFNEETIPSFIQVMIVKKLDEKTVMVVPINK